jgi:hypothetical protein
MDRLQRPKQETTRLRSAKKAGAEPQDAERLAADQKVDEASIESMVGSDPPGYLPMRIGAPDERQGVVTPDERVVRRLAHDLWEREGRQPGRDEEYWHRALDRLRRDMHAQVETGERSKRRRSG